MSDIYMRPPEEHPAGEPTAEDMGLLEHDWIVDPAKVRPHEGHALTVATYRYDDQSGNLAIECEDCSEVIADIDYEEEA